MATARWHKLSGDLYVDSGSGVIHADGSGLASASVPFLSVERGTAGHIAMYKESAPDAGALTSGIAKSATSEAGSVMLWDAQGCLDGVGVSSGVLTVDSMTINNTPAQPNDAATVEYVADAIGIAGIGLTWLKPVISTVSGWGDGSAVNPQVGDRYLEIAGGGGWTKDHIYEYTGGVPLWTDIVPEAGMAVTSLSGPTSFNYPSVALGWIVIGFNGMHDYLYGKVGTNSVSSNEMDVVGPAVESLVLSWATASDRAWTCVAELVGVSTASAGRAHFSWQFEVSNVGGTASIDPILTSLRVVGDLANATATITASGNLVRVRVSVPDTITSSWRATIEGTFVSAP